jgi:thiol-disulfide isomerase/thioredoxin
MNRNLAFVGLIIVAIVVLLFATKSRPHNNGGQDGGRLTAGDVTGAVAPEFELKLLDGNGKTLKLSELKGKAVVLNFWATYCVPCKTEMPELEALQKQYASQGLQIVGVTKDDDTEKAISEFSKKMGINYPVLLGTEKVEDLYGGIDGLPTTFFIDRSGKVVTRKLGQMSRDQIVEGIKKSLG